MIDATCTWGDGPDVLVVLKDSNFMLYEDPKFNKPPQGSPAHGYVTKGSICLTADEALQLAAYLESAANNAKELDRMCQEHDEEAANQAKAFEILADRPLNTLTCHECPNRGTCLYNTDEDCLALK